MNNINTCVIHLADEIKGKSYLPEYINYSFKIKNSELHQEIEDHLCRLYDNICLKLMGENWESFCQEHESELIMYRIYLSKIMFPTGDYYRLVNNQPLFEYYYRYYTNKEYPDIGLGCYVTSKEFGNDYNDILDLIKISLQEKQEITRNLIDLKIFNPSGKLFSMTYEDLKRKSPEMFDWHIRNYFIGIRGYDQVKFITVEEDLNELKSWF